MAASVGLSLCHTSRGRLTVATVIVTALFIACVLYNSEMYRWGGEGERARSVPIYFPQQQQHQRTVLHTGGGGERRSRAREDRLMRANTADSPPSPSNNRSCGQCGAKRFPSALIIGVRKGGTRALIDMLKSHPDVAAAGSEVHFFDRDENFERGVRWYIEQMPHSTRSQITVEKSPSYFVSQRAPGRIRGMSPRMKLILIVRNPVDRTISDYTQLLRKGRRKGSFEEELFLLSGEINTKFYPLSISTYDIYFEKWLENFQIDQIHLVDGDTLIKNPAGELEKTERFLGIGQFFSQDMFYFNSTKGFYCWKKFDERGTHLVPNCLGSAKGHALPQLSNYTVQRLVEYFRPHNERFFMQAQRRFNWDTAYSNIADHSKFQ